MATSDKIEVLAESAQWDLCCTSACVGGARGAGRERGPGDRWIYPAALPNGRTVRLFKVLMSNDCRNDCAYCAVRAGSKHRRVTLSPEELARLFLDLHRQGLAEGVFLSSAVRRGPDETMDDMLAAAELLRFKYGFRGFVHLKVLPGASFDRVERAAELADRVSINLEAPHAAALARVCPDKDFDRGLMQRMRWVSRLVRSRAARAKSHTTQFVIGAADESDRDVLAATSRLYADLRLQRAYFSAFQPHPDSLLAGRPPAPRLREHRLYQCDYLLRRYGFSFEELRFEDDGMLPLEADPKRVWADAHPEFFPVEVNRAPRAALLRVPGVGPKSASRIVRRRRKEKFRSLDELRAVGCVTRRAARYLTIDGKPGAPRPAKQLVLWSPAAT